MYIFIGKYILRLHVHIYIYLHMHIFTHTNSLSLSHTRTDAAGRSPGLTSKGLGAQVSV